MKASVNIPVVSRQNGKTITNLYLAAKLVGMSSDQIKELFKDINELTKDICGYDC